VKKRGPRHLVTLELGDIFRFCIEPEIPLVEVYQPDLLLEKSSEFRRSPARGSPGSDLTAAVHLQYQWRSADIVLMPSMQEKTIVA